MRQTMFVVPASRALAGLVLALFLCAAPALADGEGDVQQDAGKPPPEAEAEKPKTPAIEIKTDKQHLDAHCAKPENKDMPECKGRGG